MRVSCAWDRRETDRMRATRARPKNGEGGEAVSIEASRSDIRSVCRKARASVIQSWKGGIMTRRNWLMMGGGLMFGFAGQGQEAGGLLNRPQAEGEVAVARAEPQGRSRAARDCLQRCRNGHHHLRYVGQPLLPERRQASGRDGGPDEQRRLRGAGQRSPDHSRSEWNDGRLCRHAVPAAHDAGAQGYRACADHELVSARIPNAGGRAAH